MAITGPRRWLTAVTAALALTGRAAIRDGQPFAVRVTGPGPASAAGDPSGEPAHPAVPIPPTGRGRPTVNSSCRPR